MSVVFYSSIARSFRTTLVGYFYEVCQKYPVVLLSEELDPETDKIIRDKKLFPKLKVIIPVNQLNKNSATIAGAFSLNKYARNLAREIIKKYKPDIVIAPGSYFFESYLRRFAKKEGAVTISGIGSILIKNKKEYRNSRIILTAGRNYLFLPLFFRIFMARIKKYLGHFVYYWVFPALIGQAPFINHESSVLVWEDYSRTKGADYYSVYSEEDKNYIAKEGGDPEKLLVLRHPFAGKSRDFLLRNFFQEPSAPQKKFTIVEEAVATNTGNMGSPIVSSEERERQKIKIVKNIAKKLSGWEILIKPHPMDNAVPGKFQKMIENFQPISKSVKVLNPLEPADKYINISQAMAVYSPCTTIFTTSFLSPKKPIFFIDYPQKSFAKDYKNSSKVEYIDSEEKLNEALEGIKNGTYKRVEGKKLKCEGFSGMLELIDFVLSKK